MDASDDSASSPSPPARRPSTSAGRWTTGCTSAPGSYVRATLCLGSPHHQYFGRVHGGIDAIDVEGVASEGACAAVADRGRYAVGTTNTTDFLRPVDVGRVEVIAEPLSEEYTVSSTPGHRDVVSWIGYHATRTPTRTAIRDLHRGVDLTYGELDSRVRALAAGLASTYGVTAGDRVAVLSRTDARVLEALHACALLGAIAVPLNWRLSATELTAIGADCSPRVLLAETWAADAADEVATEVGFPVLHWASETGDSDGYDALAGATPPADWVPTRVHEDSDWTIIYTSGTTGTPKGVRATHRGTLATMLGISAAMGVSRDSRCLTVLPLFHVAGLQLFAEPILYAGGTVVLARTFDPARTLEMICAEDEPITHLCGVPAHYQFMQQLPAFAEAPLRPFTAVVGGPPVPQALVRTWAARGVALTTSSASLRRARA